MAEHTMQIGEVAERTSLSLRTLRHYDEIGLVNPSARTEGGFRLYTESDLARLMLVRRMKPLGYTLEEMRKVLHVFNAMMSNSDSPLREELDAIRTEAMDRRRKLVAQVEMAQEFLTQLDSLVED